MAFFNPKLIDPSLLHKYKNNIKSPNLVKNRQIYSYLLKSENNIKVKILNNFQLQVNHSWSRQMNRKYRF